MQLLFVKRAYYIIRMLKVLDFVVKNAPDLYLRKGLIKI